MDKETLNRKVPLNTVNVFMQEDGKIQLAILIDTNTYFLPSEDRTCGILEIAHDFHFNIKSNQNAVPFIRNRLADAGYPFSMLITNPNEVDNKFVKIKKIIATEMSYNKSVEKSKLSKNNKTNYFADYTDNSEENSKY